MSCKKGIKYSFSICFIKLNRAISLNFSTNKSLKEYILTSLIIFALFILIDLMFQFNLTFATAKSDNPVISWNKFTTNLTLEQDLSPPKLARAYALVHISIYDSLLSSKNHNLSNTIENDKALIYWFCIKSIVLSISR